MLVPVKESAFPILKNRGSRAPAARVRFRSPRWRASECAAKPIGAPRASSKSEMLRLVQKEARHFRKKKI